MSSGDKILGREEEMKVVGVKQSFSTVSDINPSFKDIPVQTQRKYPHKMPKLSQRRTEKISKVAGTNQSGG